MKGMEDPPRPSDFEVALMVVIVLTIAVAYCSACASIERTSPDGTTFKLDPGTNGCALVEMDPEGHVTRAMIQHNGMSNPLAGTLRSIIGSAAGVFGGGEADSQKIVSSEGCVGMMRLPPPPEDEKECEQ